MLRCRFLPGRIISIPNLDYLHLLASPRSAPNSSLPSARRSLFVSLSHSSSNPSLYAPRIAPPPSPPRLFSRRSSSLHCSNGFAASDGISTRKQNPSVASRTENASKIESRLLHPNNQLQHHSHAPGSSDGNRSLQRRGTASEWRKNVMKNESVHAESDTNGTTSSPEECSTDDSYSRRKSFLRKENVSGKKAESFSHKMHNASEKEIPSNNVDEVSPKNAEFLGHRKRGLCRHKGESFQKEQIFSSGNGKSIQITELLEQKEQLYDDNNRECTDKEIWGDDIGESINTADLLKKQGLPHLIVSEILDAMPISKRTKTNLEQLVSLVCFLRTMDMEIEKFPMLVRSAPFMYQRDPTLHLEPKIAYLETLGIARKDMCRLILKYPYSLYRPMEVIQAQIEFLKSLSLEDEHLQKIIKKSPLAFRLDAETHLKPRLEFLKSLGLFPDDMKKAVLNNSRILSMTTDKLKKTTNYLQSLGFRIGTEQLSKVILRCGSVTCETLQEGLKNLSMVGLSQYEVETLLIRLPIVLSRKRTDTNNKFKYLVEEMNRLPNEILSCPVFLMLSLDKRIKPRYQALSQWRMEKQVKREYSLSYIFLPSDKVLLSRFPGLGLKSSS